MSKNVLKLKRAVHFFLKELRSDPDRRPFDGDKYYCPVCQKGVAYFNPMNFEVLDMLDKNQYVYPMFSSETINMFKYTCPRCGANDRDRLYTMYFDKRMAGVDKTVKYNLLDIAPSALQEYLRKQPFINYRSADLYFPDVDDKVDITDMSIYADGRFDIFICSHVLEHVKDDRKAMKELYRVLKPGGWGIAMVPINISITETFEDEKITSVEDRWKYYGQDDHVRMYSKKGFISRLEEAGFKLTLYGIDYFGNEQFEKNGIHPRSILYIVEKL
jgi:SAM-dependent methyltransferase